MIATIVLKCSGVRFVWRKVAFWWTSKEVFRYARVVCLYVCIERGIMCCKMFCALYVCTIVNVLRGSMCCTRLFDTLVCYGPQFNVFLFQAVLVQSIFM